MGPYRYNKKVLWAPCKPNPLYYAYIYILVCSCAFLCIYMHRESGTDSEVDPIVKLIWSKVCITIYITISITSLITIVA